MIMPTIKQLEEFTAHFRTLGNEAGISSERGVPYNGLPLPDTEAAGDPFANMKSGGKSGAASADNPQDDGLDYSAFLDTLPDDLGENTNDDVSQNTENPDFEDFDFNDGLGDLLSGFADDIQNENTYPPEFTGTEFPDPNTPGNVVDVDFEELGDFGNLDNTADLEDSSHLEDTAHFEDAVNLNDFDMPEDASNVEGDTGSMDSADFGGLDDFNMPEDFSGMNNVSADNDDLSEHTDDLDFGGFGDLGNFDDSTNLEDTAHLKDAMNLDDFSMPEDASTGDADTGSMDFGGLDNLNFPEDSDIEDTDSSVISNDEMLSLFSETPEDTIDTESSDDLSSSMDLSGIEDISGLEDISSDDDFSFNEDLGTDIVSGTQTSIEDADKISDDELGAGFDMSIPEEHDFDSSNFSAEDSIPDMDEDFSIPDMDDDIRSDTQSSFDDEMDLGGESFEAAESADSEKDDDIEELDSFDAFNLEDEDNASSSVNMPESDFNIDDIAYSEIGDSAGSDFSLEGIDDIFNRSSGEKHAVNAGTFHVDTSEEVEEIHLSQEELSKLIHGLNSYPLNLRIACEEIIAEQAVAPELMSELIKKLVNGASPKDAAALAGKILGKKIPVPKGFLKKTGEELEAEQSSFKYIFVHNFLPVLRTFAIFAALLFCLGFLIHQFIYIPIRADGIYKRGYEQIESGGYARANELFLEALEIRQIKNWFFRYAEAFRDNRQYAYSEQKYDELLRLYPKDKKGALDYAYLETYYLYNYEKADRILRNHILDYSVDDREGLFAQGENFLAWGEIDPPQLENARAAFARLIERYGEQDIYLEQMLKYFMRTDNLAQVLPLQDYFFASNKTKIAAPTLAELGGYLLDKKFEEARGVPDANIDNIENIRDVLFRAVKADSSLPESHYHLARYYSHYGNIQEEQIVLETAIKAFDAAPELSAKRLAYRIDNQRRYARILTNTKYFVDAQENLIKGIGLYEDALNRRVLSPTPDYGRLYADLADIEYFKNGDFNAALQNYLNAERNGWHPPEVIYRMGSIYYHTDRMAEAMEHFFEVSNKRPLNRRLLYALGNTSYLRGNYSAAQGYYNRLLDLLETEKVRAAALLPHDRPEHMELAERIMVAQNNLGVTLETLADRSGDVNFRTRALALYSESARAWDFITRNPTSMVRFFIPGTAIPRPNQSLLNQKNTLYPEPGFEPLIYNQIDMDVEDPSRWESLVPQDNLARDIPSEIRNGE